jgi:glycosyltransferase involved in cell wall biosynthesis
MRIVFLTGIWPPDVGGPATHGPDFARFLTGHGHEVRVITMGDGEPTDLPCPVEVIARGRPFPIRYSTVAYRGAIAARSADALYATGTYAAAAFARVASRTPLVVKLVSDPAYERAYRYRIFGGTLEEFEAERSPKLAAIKRARTLALRAARTIVVPSAYLAGFAERWGLGAEIVVVSNPAPDVTAVIPRELEPGTISMVGRLVRHKGVDVVLDAVARVPSAKLVIVGDGPERDELERRAQEPDLAGRVTFLGAVPRDEGLEIVAGADISVLASDWENLPHAAVEALAVGTPVVATAVGGVPEVVHDGVNGLLVPARRPDLLADALARLLDDDGLRAGLAAATRASVEPIARDRVYGRIEQLLVQGGES